MRRSGKRDAILKQLSCRSDHPTAETLYAELKPEIPDLSLATVYRNLKQLEEKGVVMSIPNGGATRYDAKTELHSHFFCRHCGAVLDLDHDSEDVLAIGQKNFSGLVEECSPNFFGLCPLCVQSLDKSERKAIFTN
ncbi:MAG: transcriptional repressor [Firmicutes bacterium]|nr:transcriptional repressor [Bacillota bacterium]